MRVRPSSSSLVALFASAIVTISSSALAQDPPPNAATNGSPGAVPATSSSRPITTTCSLGDHPGIDEADARTAAGVVCHELAKQRATGEHEVRFGKLGGRTMVALASRNGSSYEERLALLYGIDEIDVAAPRLVNALVEGKPLDETRNVDNVLSSESRQPKSERGVTSFDGGIFGATAMGASSAMSAGIALGILYRGGRFGLGAQGRAGGIGGDKDSSTNVLTLDVGGRYYLSSSEFAPFLGAGFEISDFEVKRAGPNLSGSGFGAYVSAGAEFLRTHSTALSMSVRADTPFYELHGYSTSQYVVPVSLNVGLLFH